MKQPATPNEIPAYFANAWNSGDAAALARLFSEDADFVNVVGLWWSNRSDIERAHAYGLSTFFKDSKLSAGRVEIRHLDDAIAVVHVRWKLVGQRDKVGALSDDRRTVMMFVAEHRSDGWAVVAAQNTDVIPGKETLAVKDGAYDAINYVN